MTTAAASLPFEAVFVDSSAGQPKTLARDFLDSGRFPLVDQGQELVGGYTDDESALCRAQLPVIVFGDHTRAVKYVDFPFGVGADGVKVLRPARDDDPRFLYWYLRAAMVRASGYDRHFKYLKRLQLSVPPVEEQRRIAAILDAADGLRAKRWESLALLDSLTESIFLDMFGDPTTNPRGFAVEPLAAVVAAGTSVTYGIVQAGNEHPGGVPYIRTCDIVSGQIVVDQLRRTAPELAAKFVRSRVAPGDIVMSIRATVGTTAMVPSCLGGANLTQGTARISPGVRTLGSYLLTHLRATGTQRWIQRQVKGATFREITLKRLRELPVMVPPVELQQEFDRTARSATELASVAESGARGLEALFASLQHRAFRGEL